MGDLDIAAKVLMQEAPGPFVALALGFDVEVKSVRAEDKELPAQARVLDKLFEVALRGKLSRAGCTSTLRRCGSRICRGECTTIGAWVGGRSPVR
jgi:hypothetical protein